MLKILPLYPFKSIEQPEFEPRHRDTNSHNVSIYKFEDLVGSATCELLVVQISIYPNTLAR